MRCILETLKRLVELQVKKFLLCKLLIMCVFFFSFFSLSSFEKEVHALCKVHVMPNHVSLAVQAS